MCYWGYMYTRNTILILIGICCAGGAAVFINGFLEDPEAIYKLYGMNFTQLVIFLAIGVIIQTLFLRLTIAVVNKLMLNEATAIRCPFWQLLIVIIASSLIGLLPIPIVNFILSLVAFYYLLMVITKAPLIELIIVTVLCNIGMWLFFKILETILLAQQSV